MLDRGLGRPSDGEVPERVVFFLCSGSRATLAKPRKGRPLLLQDLLRTTVKQVERITARHPETEVVVVYYRDVRTYERAFESFYTRLKGMGVEFVRREIDSMPSEDGRESSGQHRQLGEGEEPDIDEAELDDGSSGLFDSDLVVLASAQVPRRSSSASPGVSSGSRPTVTASRGEPGAALSAHRVHGGPGVRGGGFGGAEGRAAGRGAGGSAAAMKALPCPARGPKETGKFSSRIDPPCCIRCRTLHDGLPHGAIRMTEEGAVATRPSARRAVSAPPPARPTRRSSLNFSDGQLLAQTDVAFERAARGRAEDPGPALLLVLLRRRGLRRGQADVRAGQLPHDPYPVLVVGELGAPVMEMYPHGRGRDPRRRAARSGAVTTPGETTCPIDGSPC